MGIASQKPTDLFSFSNIGDVDLGLPEALQGDVWRYRNAGRRYPMHHHRELEFALALQGTASYLMGSQRYTMKPHSVVWLFPGQDHILLEESDDFAMWQAVFKPELLEWACRTSATSALRELNPSGHFCKRLGGHEAERLVALFQDLSGRMPETDYFNAGLGFLLLTAWAVYGAAGQAVPGTRLHPAVEEAARLLRAETTPLTLEAVAAQVGLGPARLSRLFREQIGVSLLHFRDKQRVERFLYRCRQTDRPNLIHLALESGFGSYAQFHRVFKRVTGSTPSKWGVEEP